MHVEAMTPQSITQEQDEPLFFLYDWYQHERDRADQCSLARGYRIGQASVEEVVAWIDSVPPGEEPGFTARRRELFALVPRQDRPGEYASMPLLTRVRSPQS